MKVLVFTAFVVLLLASLDQTQAVAPFFRVFIALGYKLATKTYYAKCNPRDFPSHLNCPSVAYGFGGSKNSAIKAARWYADGIENGCGRYVGHCQVKKFLK